MPLFFERANDFILKLCDPYGPTTESSTLTDRWTRSPLAPGPPTLPTNPISDAIHNTLPASDTLRGRSDCPSGPPTPPRNQPNQPPVQGILEGARDFKIENSILTNVQGDALMFRFEFGGPPTEEFKSLFAHHMEGLINVKDLDKIAVKITEYGLTQAIRDLPRARAAYNDYTSSKRRRTTCFENTRQALLKEIALCLASTDGPRAYLLFGIAGIGKSTVAQTVAEKADNLRLLGASFFFSRDEADRRTAEKFFTSIAFQLCAYDKQFSEAIGAVLTKERGAAATSKDPQEQLTVLILEPLRDIDRSRSLPTVIVVDALDECDVDDGPIVLMALGRLVQELPSFRVVLTSRPQPHLQYLLDRLCAHQVFRMEDIEQKVVEGDIRHYLEYSLSPDQVRTRLPMLRRKWAANDQEINSLVKAAGRLFIIASTMILFILDPAASNPELRMKRLRDEFARNRTPFNALNDFYTLILRTAVPLDCERDIVERYQSAVGAIVLMEDPLPVEALANLIGMLEDDVHYVLGNLQSVISLGSNGTPLVYHRSFPDYITDDQRCRDTDLRIVPRDHHTRLATRCLHIMNARLKRNILGLGAVSQYSTNKKALEEEQLSWDSVQQVIPAELQYASVHWAKHVAQANLGDSHLMSELNTFTEEHLLHWLEALSWLCKLDSAPVPLGIVQRLQALNSDMRQIFSDALRFVARDYEKIIKSALYIYHTALPFTPTETSFYKKYKRQVLLCQIEGGQVRWDVLIAKKKHGGYPVYRIAYANDDSQFASWDKDNVKLWDGATCTPVRTFDANAITLAGDFSVFGALQGSSVTMYSVSSSAPIASFNHSSAVNAVTISFDGSWLATGLKDRTVCVWDIAKGVSIASLEEYNDGLLVFSPHGHMLAFTSKIGINLWNRAGVVAKLEHELWTPVKIAFSSDGARLVTLANKGDGHNLRLWNSENKDLIAVVRAEGEEVVVSVDGSFIATGHGPNKVQVWSGDSLALVDTIPVNHAQSLAFSDYMLAIATWPDKVVILYDAKRKASIAMLQIDDPFSLAFSPDGTRLVAGNVLGAVHLWDVPSIIVSASTPVQNLSPVSALAFSQDCSRLASGHEEGSVELWDTGNMRQAICHEHHSGSVSALAFSPDGNQLASGSDDKSVRFWDGRNGSSVGVLEHTFPDWLSSLAFSSSLLAAATEETITLWDRTSLRLIHTFEQGGYQLSFSFDGSALASIGHSDTDDGVSKMTVWDTENFMVTATFTVPGSVIITLLPSPNGSKVAVQDLHFGSKFFDVANKEVISDPENNDLSWVPRLNRIPMSWNWSYDDGDRLVGWVSARHDCVPMLYFPLHFDLRVFASQSSMFALGCKDGRILLIRRPR